MKKKRVIILIIMILGIILIRKVIVNISKETIKKGVNTKKEIALDKVKNDDINRGVSNDSENEESDEVDNEDMSTTDKGEVEEIKNIIIENYEDSSNNENNSDNYKFIVSQSEIITSSNNSDGIKVNEETKIDYSTNLGAPDTELLMSYDYLRVYLENGKIKVYKNITGTWEYHADVTVMENAPYTFNSVSTVYMMLDARIPEDKTYELNIVTYDHQDRFRTESYIEVLLYGQVIYTKYI